MKAKKNKIKKKKKKNAKKKIFIKNYLKFLQSAKVSTREYIKTKNSKTVEQKQQSEDLRPLQRLRWNFF